jgi:cell wall-associated NlpC family hydrolase
LGFSNGLRVISLSSAFALAIVASQVAPVGAADPAATTTAATDTTVATATVVTASVVKPPVVRPNIAASVVSIAVAQRGKRYASGGSGPSAFDCSGLVRYAYIRAGVGSHLGGGHSGYSMLAWARAHHLADTSNPQVGDVVIYGGGSHAAIYIGGGRVISALNWRLGIRITGLHALGTRVTAYIHTNLSGAAARAVAAPPVVHAAPHAVSGPQVVAKVAARVRASASTTARVLGVLAKGAHVGVSGSARVHGVLWYRVSYHGQTGWVRANLVRAG